MTAQFCGDCGARRSTPEQRFCVGCGQAFDDAPATPSAHPSVAAAPATTAAPTWARPEAPVPPAWTPPPSWSAPDGEQAQPDYAVPATLAPTPRTGRAAKLVGVGALALALTGAGVVGWQVLGPNDGGADSPEIAAEKFISAVAEQDGVGMLAVVNPGEVDGLDDVYASARDRLETEGLITGDALSEAVDLEFEDLEFDVDELGDDVVRVTLTDGTMTASYDPSGLPDRLDFVADEFPDGESETVDLADELRDADYEVGLTVIERDGRWYVSLLGTAADLVYQENNYYDQDLRRPDFDAVSEQSEPVVGATPEDVVANLVEAVDDGDVGSVVDQLPADLAVGLRPYAQVVERYLEDYGLSADVTQEELELDVEELDDGLVRVTIDEATFSADGYEYGELQGGGEVSLYDTCLESRDDEGYGDSGCVPENLLDDLGIDAAYLLMREVDGGYQLDPVATVSSYASTVIESFPSDVLDELLTTIETGDDDFFECRYSDYCD